MKNLVVPVSDIVFMRTDGSVYLMRRHNTGYADGMYALPAGHIEKGESPIQAALRETFEETGCVLSEKDIQFVHVIHRRIGTTPNDEREYVDFIFLCTAWNGEPRIIESDKCDHSMWCRIGALPENTVPYVRVVLEYVQQQKSYSEISEPLLRTSKTHT